MKKLILFLLCLSVLFTCAPFAFADAPEDVSFLLDAEYYRLYQLPLTGGEGRLLLDQATLSVERAGGAALASTGDGSVYRIDLSSGDTGLLASCPANPANHLYALNDGFVALSFSMREGMHVFFYNGLTGSYDEVFRGRNISNLCTLGNTLLFMEYPEKQPTLYAYDLFTGTKLMETAVSSNAVPYRFGNDLYLFSSNESRLERIDLAGGRLMPVDLYSSKTDNLLLYAWNGAYLFRGSYQDNYTIYLVTESSRRIITIGYHNYPVVADACGKYVLFQDSEYLESTEREESWYLNTRYYVLNMEDGSVTEVPFFGQYAKLFSEGDFPLMDSSTARKPVTSMLFSFFCESSGAGGSVPLCSTTHNAWLNIADSAADIALLAAPTEEEQAYLDSRGVTVEMKLYGGDGLVFIGNKACGVENLTLDQVRGIYRGEFTNWAQLGGTDHPIRVLYRDDQSGSQRLFERLLWKDEPVPDLEALGFDILDEMSSIVSQCLYDPYAIGYSIMTYLNDLYGNEDLLAYSLEGYTATPENVAAKNYPLSTQGYVVIRSDEPADSPARRLFNFFGSPLSDYILTYNGITPLKDGG